MSNAKKLPSRLKDFLADIQKVNSKIGFNEDKDDDSDSEDFEYSEDPVNTEDSLNISNVINLLKENDKKTITKTIPNKEPVSDPEKNQVPSQQAQDPEMKDEILKVLKLRRTRLLGLLATLEEVVVPENQISFIG